MMISPEAYYKEYLQGKSQSEILQQIRQYVMAPHL